MGAPVVTTKEVRATLADVIGRARFAGERVVITCRGRPAVAVVPIADLCRLEAAETPPRHASSAATGGK